MTGILEQIGNTPMVRLRHCVFASGAEIWMKLEELGGDAVIATIAVDTGFKYMSVAPYQQLGS